MNGASVLALVRITDVDKSYTHLVVSGESLPEVQEAGLSHVNWCGQVLNIYMLLLFIVYDSRRNICSASCCGLASHPPP